MASTMNELMDFSTVTVKSEPEDCDDADISYDTRNMLRIAHNITSLTTIQSSNSFLNDPDSNSQHDHIEPNSFAVPIFLEITSNDMKLEPLSPETNFHNEEPNNFICNIESDANANELNFIDCKLEPISSENETSAYDFPMTFDTINCKLESLSEENRLLLQKYQIRDCYVSLERLRQYPKLSFDGNVQDFLYLNQCNICRKFFKTRKCLRRHIPSHTKRFRCDYCSQDFGLKATLIRHIECKHSGLSFVCTVCDKSLSCPASLRRHQGVHTKPFSCDICSLTFAHKIVYENHVASHYGDRYQCDQCDSSFPSIAYLKSHKYNHRTSEQNQLNREKKSGFECKVCGKVFVRKDRLKIHVLEQHEVAKERAFRCEFCLKDFATAIRCRLHRRRVHIKPRIRVEGEHKCDTCELSFHFLTELQFHQEVHATVKEHACPMCPENFSSIGNLARHRKSHKL